MIPPALALLTTLATLLACALCGVLLDGENRQSGVTLCLVLVLIILPSLTKESPHE